MEIHFTNPIVPDAECFYSLKNLTMEKTFQNTILNGADGEVLHPSFNRRKFLSVLGIGVASTAVVTLSCNKDNGGSGNSDSVDLGSGDTGILNYAYALEQLEAAFYMQVINTPYTSITAAETSLLTDIRDHEVAHREFFKKAIGSAAIPALVPDFSKVNFSSRDSVLATAKAFEDLGVAAYNGAGQLIVKSDYLLLAGKIVSVEARHAALVRDLISNGSFADNTVIDTNGLDKAMLPKDVLTIAQVYIKTKVSGNSLPTS